jgi:CheY-like chemotaxis protein
LKSLRDIKRVLFADDDADERALFESAYQSRNDIELFPSLENGSEVIQTLESIKNDFDLPDIIILDQNMPLMTGKQTLAFLKSNSRYTHIPVCICSTYADHKLIEDCIKLGAYKILSKPVTEEEYHAMMDHFLAAFDVVN